MSPAPEAMHGRYSSPVPVAWAPCPVRCYGAAMLTDRAGLPADELAQLTTRIEGHRTLGHVVRDWATVQPPRPLVEIVTQDEYTHDVIYAYRDSIHLVYDTT